MFLGDLPGPRIKTRLMSPALADMFFYRQHHLGRPLSPRPTCTFTMLALSHRWLFKRLNCFLSQESLNIPQRELISSYLTWKYCNHSNLINTIEKMTSIIMNNWLKISMVLMQCVIKGKNKIRKGYLNISYFVMQDLTILLCLWIFFLKIYFPKSQQGLFFSPSETSSFKQIIQSWSPCQLSCFPISVTYSCNKQKQNGGSGLPPQVTSAGSRGLWATGFGQHEHLELGTVPIS